MISVDTPAGDARFVFDTGMPFSDRSGRRQRGRKRHLRPYSTGKGPNRQYVISVDTPAGDARFVFDTGMPRLTLSESLGGPWARNT